MQTRVLVLDPREIFRAGVKAACESRDDLKVVAEAESFEAGIELSHLYHPDVVVIQSELVERTDVDYVSKLAEPTGEKAPAILIISKDCTADAVARMSEIGASGLLTFQASLEEMAVAIRCVAMGRVFISHTHATVHPPVLKDLRSPSEPDAQSANQSSGQSTHDLSARELEVLELVSQGMTNKQAASKMFLSVKTVETYRSRIMKKHGLRDRMDLMQFAKRVMEPSMAINA